MTVGFARLSLYLPHSHSLKEKRMVLRRVKDRVRQKFNVAIAEVAHQDLLQRAVVGLAVVGSDRRFVESALDEVMRFVEGEGEVLGAEREIQTLGDTLAETDLGFKFE